MNHCAIGYHNVLAEETISASSEAAGFEKENAYDGIPVDYWKPSSVPAWLKAAGRMPAGMWLGDTTAETLVGTELVTNGDFASNVSGWSVTSEGTITWVAGKMRITNNDAIDPPVYAYQAITTVVGKQYVVPVDVTTGTIINFALWVGTSAGDFSLGAKSSTTSTTVMVTFTATTTTTYLSLRINTNAVGYLDVDNVSARLAAADITTNNNGFAVNGTVVKDAVTPGADLVGASNWSTSNFLEQPYNSDLDPGTGAFSYTLWFKCSASSTLELLLQRDSAVSASRVTIYIDATTSAIIFAVDDDTTVRSATGSIAVDDGEWHQFCGVYDGNGGVFGYLDGALHASSTGAALLTMDNASATLIVGSNQSATADASSCEINLIDCIAELRTAAEIKSIYDDEKGYFLDDGEVLETLVSTRATSADYFAMYGHDFADSGSNVVLQYSDDDSAWTNAFDPISVATSAPIFKTFARSSHKYWRVYVTGFVQQAGVIMFGKKLSMQRGLYTGFEPMALASENKPINSESGNGHFLGRSTKKVPINAVLSFNNLTPAWVRANWPQLLADLESGPFFVLPSPDNFADEPAFCWTSGNIRTPRYGASNLMSVSLPIKARIS